MSWFQSPTILAQTTSILTGAGDAPTDLGGNVSTGLGMIGILLAVFIIPFVIGHFLAKRIKMPTHASSIGVILAAIIASVAIILTIPLRYGIDIVGGMNLIYELDKAALSERVSDDGQRVGAKDLMRPLKERLDPAGTKELVIRPNGEDQIEIIIPKANQSEIEETKKIISNAGILEFRIVANSNDHRDIIALARKTAESATEFERMARDVRDENGKAVGVWRAVGREDVVRNGVRPLRAGTDQSAGQLLRDAATGRLVPPYTGSMQKNGFENFLARQGINDVELLLALEKAGKEFPNVTGADIANARVEPSASGSYNVLFKMRAGGALKLQNLTLRNQPDPNTDFHRKMAILLDERILSAPQLNQPISTDGQITGNFTKDEADYLQKILQSGSLPAALNKIPISEQQVGAALGETAINKGFVAATGSLIITALFMLVYYRFSGIVACVALTINLLLVFAFIILIRQPITMPGLAGLILSVGMSVDANVLVFERMREEIAKRSTGRLAIRNGFDRAFTTILDSNLTTLISAGVLYWVGTDQVRGFAITLIIGIVCSMFTAVFCSRVIFEICERQRLVSFSMSDIIGFLKKTILGESDVNFMKWRNVCYAVSFTAMAAGLIAPIMRGSQIFDIDFSGGSSVTFMIDKPLSADEVREKTDAIFAVDAENLPIEKTLTNVQIANFENRVFKLDTSLKDVDEVTRRLVEGFKDWKANLLTYSVDASIRPSESDSSQTNSGSSLKFVAFQADESAATETAATESAAADSTGATTDAATAVAVDPNVAAATVPSVRTMVDLKFSSSVDAESARINASSLSGKLVESAKKAGVDLNLNQLRIQPKDAKDWTLESEVGYPEWVASLPYDQAKTQEVVSFLEQEMQSEPVWQSVAKIDARVAGEMQARAIFALVVSMIGITLYIWVRFQKISYGLAAMVALVHDVLITLAFIALSHWVFRYLGFLMIDDFKISLTMVAAFLTIIGYSLNDTIVVFDRIREVKGKAPRLTADMINQSVNQTLSRTLLTSSTTIFAVALLYFFGGEAVHGFSFALFIGIVVGTYSSIFIAAPILLWFAQREEAKRDARLT